MLKRKLTGCFAFVVSVALLGCGPSVGTVTGTVTYGNKPLKGGTVVFTGESGSPTFSTMIELDGSYKLENVRSGKYKVLVDTSGLKGPSSNATYAPGAGPKKKSNAPVKNEPPPSANLPEGYKMGNPANQQREESMKRYVQIPEKYSKFQETTLTVEVKGGSQTIPLQLD